jgi:hypothetical protein
MQLLIFDSLDSLLSSLAYPTNEKLKDPSSMDNLLDPLKSDARSNDISQSFL